MSAAERAGALLTIDLGAIRKNYLFLSGHAPGAECAAAVKANAYGLGMGRVAPVLADAGCRTFFVALIDEGIALRKILPDAVIYVLCGPFAHCEDDFTEHALIPVLNDRDQIARWAEAARRRAAPLPAALHVDTGMTRLGLSEDEVDDLARNPDRLTGLDVRLVMSHLACAEDGGDPKNADQLARFRAARQRLPWGKASLANSSGILLGPDYHFDMVRPGAALYGVAPSGNAPNPMAQTVHLQGRILQLHDVDSPMTVGYGATYPVPRKGKIATVSVGYADGYLRALSNRGSARIGAVRVPVVGRVSMDLITLDVTDAAPELVHPGAFVDLLDPIHTVDALGKEAGTNGYEILTGLGTRYARRYIGGEA